MLSAGLTAPRAQVFFEESPVLIELLQLFLGDKGVNHSGSSQMIPPTCLTRLRRELGKEADNPTYILDEPRVGYPMAGGECLRALQRTNG